MNSSPYGSAFDGARLRRARTPYQARPGPASSTSSADGDALSLLAGGRLDRLSPEANTLLTLVEEALAGRVLEETGSVGQYRFTHALMQETLAGELSAARQVRLHGQIAETLDRLYGERADAPMVARLARHYAESALLNRTHALAAVRYSRLAGEQAAAALGWDEAARHYERSLALIADARDPLGEDEAALWDELAQCRRASGAWADARAALDHALALYAARGDSLRGARALLRFFGAGYGRSEASAAEPLTDTLIAALGDEDSAELCGLLANRAAVDRSATGDARAERAAGMAARLGLAGAAYPWRITLRAGLLLEERGEFRAASASHDALHAEIVASGVYVFAPLWRRSFTLMLASDIAAAIASLEDGRRFARQHGRRPDEWRAIGSPAQISWRRGDRDRYAELTAEVPVGASFQMGLLAASVAFEEGAAADALRLLPGEDHPDARGEDPIVWARALRASILCVLGEHAGARAALDHVTGVACAGLGCCLPGLGLGHAADALLELADESLVSEVADYLEGYPQLRSAHNGHANPDWLHGGLALRLGQIDEAEQHFRTGLEWATRPDVRFGIDAGRCHQGLAEVAERRGDIEGTGEHLDAAGALFAQYGTKLYLDQVLAKKEFLKA